MARVRRLLDLAHEGNLSAAAAHTGIPYPTLRDLYRGATRAPGPSVFKALARAYGVSPSWLLGDGEDLPALTLDLVLPPDPEFGTAGRGRLLRIPLAAGEFVRVFLRVEAALLRLPPAPTRPIIGGATDPELVRARLAAFLLAPALEAYRAGGQPLLGANPPLVRGRRLQAGDDARWTETLRRLGRYWALALAPLAGEE